MTRQLPNLPSTQQGSASGIISTIILAVLVLKLVISIVPAQLEDRTISSTIAEQLQESNQKKDGKRKFLTAIRTKFTVNSIRVHTQDIFTFTNETPGNLAVHKNYQVENEFFPTVFITNKFEGDITGADASE